MKLIHKLVLAFSTIFIFLLVGCNNKYSKTKLYHVNYLVDDKVFLTQVINPNTVFTSLPVPEKDGHTFTNWYYNDKPIKYLKNVESDIKLTAKFKPNLYTVTIYNFDGTCLTKNIEHGKPLEIDDGVFARDGYKIGSFFEISKGLKIFNNHHVTSNLRLMCVYIPLSKNVVTVNCQIGNYQEFNLALNQGDKLPSLKWLLSKDEKLCINDDILRNKDVYIDSGVTITTKKTLRVNFNFKDKKWTKQITAGEKLPEFAFPLSLKNIDFNYWIDSAGHRFDFNLPINKNIDLYAFYNENETENLQFKYQENENEITLTECIDKNNSLIIIPQLINDKPVTKINATCFRNSQNYETIILPDSITTIEPRSFYKCKNLKTITLSSNLREIPAECFKYCSSLLQISIPKSVQSIGFQAFFQCTKLTKLRLHEGTSYIGNASFAFCSLSSLYLPKTITELGEFAFANNYGLRNITFNNGLQKIGGWSFSNTAIESISLPQSVTYVGKNCFYFCQSLYHITIFSTAQITQKTFTNIPNLNELLIYKIGKLDFPNEWDYDYKLHKAIKNKIIEKN